MATIGLVLCALFPLAMAFAAASDLFTMTISNKLTLALFAGFILLSPLTGMDLHAFGLHFAAGGIVLAIAFACFALGWIGGGDAKLAAVVVLWFGLDHALEFLVTSAICGGVLTLLILVFRKAVILPVSVTSQAWLMRLHDQRSGVPYGIALAAAALLIYPDTIWLRIAAL